MRRLVLAAGLAAVGMGHAYAASAPGWVERARGRPVPAAAKDDPIVILIEEQMVEVSKSETRERRREAARILKSEGQGFSMSASQRIGEDFKLIGGWKIRPDGEVTTYERTAISQMDADGRYEFSKTRLNAFRPEGARVGDVIAWEYELKSKPEAYTQGWAFGRGVPVLLSRFGIRIPQDWKMRWKMANQDDMAPITDDDGFRVWEMRDLPAAEPEPMGPALLELLPRLMIAYAPGASQSDRRTFESWESVASWYAGIIGAQVVADDAIRSTAAQLAAGARSKLDAIRAIGRFAQGVRYLNVAPGRSTTEPHPAPLVLKNRFGDCEDKSVLTIALLREIGVEAYPVLARTADLGPIAPDFPAPNIFNHVIAGIQAPQDVDLPSMVDAGPLGRIILFDATDSVTGLGDLNDALQGTRGVLSHPQHGGLVTLPVLSPEASSREANLEVAFAARGGIDVKARVSYTGQYAAARRYHYETVRGGKRKEEIASQIAAQHGKSEVKSLDLKGLESPLEPVELSLDLWMPLPGKELSGLRTMAHDFLFASRTRPFAEPDRSQPVRIEVGYREQSRMVIEVPREWRVVEPLPSARATSDVGEYALSGSLGDGVLVLERSLTVRAATVPPDRYLELKKFFDDVRKADGTRVAFERPR